MHAWVLTTPVACCLCPRYKVYTTNTPDVDLQTQATDAPAVLLGVKFTDSIPAKPAHPIFDGLDRIIGRAGTARVGVTTSMSLGLRPETKAEVLAYWHKPAGTAGRRLLSARKGLVGKDRGLLAAPGPCTTSANQCGADADGVEGHLAPAAVPAVSLMHTCAVMHVHARASI